MNYFAAFFIAFYISTAIKSYFNNYQYWENKAFGANSVRFVKNENL